MLYHISFNSNLVRIHCIATGCKPQNENKTSKNKKKKYCQNRLDLCQKLGYKSHEWLCRLIQVTMQTFLIAHFKCIQNILTIASTLCVLLNLVQIKVSFSEFHIRKLQQFSGFGPIWEQFSFHIASICCLTLPLKIEHQLLASQEVYSTL